MIIKKKISRVEDKKRMSDRIGLSEGPISMIKVVR